MRRWHEERDLMRGRFRAREDEYERMGLELPDGGIGVWRKRRPGDCGRPRCGVCHYGKWLPKARAAAKRKAIEFDLAAG